jgi:transcriptional regulator GlxA family with amidase domain
MIARPLLAALCAGALLVACRSTPPIVSAHFPPAGVPLTIGFLVFEDVFNSEVTAPLDVLHHASLREEVPWTTLVVGATTEPITSFEGLTITPDVGFADCPRLDVLVVPSGNNNLGSDLEDRALIDFIIERAARAQLVMSHCDGAFLLAEAGLLDDHQATTYPGDREALAERYPAILVRDDVRFVHDRQRLTSVGGIPSYEPALYLVEKLYGEDLANDIARGLVIDWDLGDVPHAGPRPLPKKRLGFSLIF